MIFTFNCLGGLTALGYSDRIRSSNEHMTKIHFTFYVRFWLKEHIKKSHFPKI